MPTHQSMLSFSEKLGYKHKSGCCFGFTIRWIEADILDEEELFHARVKHIEKKEATLARDIQTARAKKEKNLTKKDKELLEIPSFFESLELFQQSQFYTPLFGVSQSQLNIEEISQVASCDKIIAQGGLKKIHSEVLFSSMKDLEKYLSELSQVLEQVTPKSHKPIGIILGNSDHAIGLTYRPQTGWKFMNVNSYPSKAVSKENNTEVANKIFNCLTEEGDSFLALNVKIVTTRNDPRCLNLEKKLNAFKIRNQPPIISGEVSRKESAKLAFIAAREDDLYTIDELYIRQFDFKRVTDTPYGLLEVASLYGHTEMIDKLIEYGAPVDGIDDKEPPLFLVAQRGDVGNLNKLIQHGADVNKKYGDITPIYIAAQNGYIEVVEELIKSGADIHEKTQQYATPLHIAAQNGHVEIVAKLITHGALIEEGAINGHTPLDLAAFKGHIHVVKKLIEHGADSLQLIMLATKKGNTDVILTLAKSEMVDFNVTRDDGATPLFLAALNGHEQVVEALLNNGADSNKAMEAERLTFLRLSPKDKKQQIRQLTEDKLKSNSRVLSITPLEIAKAMGHQNIVEMILLNQLKIQGPAGVCLVKELARLKHGEHNKWNPYYMNCGKKYNQIIEALEQTIDIKTALRDRESPLFRAVNMHRHNPRYISEFGFHKTKTLKEVEIALHENTGNPISSS